MLNTAVRRHQETPLLTRPEGSWVQREEPIMGSAIRVELWCEQRSRGVAAAAAVLEEVHRIDRAMSPHHPGSELCRINREAARRPVTLTAEMFCLIDRALHFSRLSDGAFDISSAAPLARAGALVGWHHLELDRATRTLRFASEGMRIDLGGFAMGHAVDRCTTLLRERGIAHAMVSAGSGRRVIGSRRDAQGTRPWSVAIPHPRQPGDLLVVLPLQEVSVSTSGDDKGHFNGGAEGLHSVTVLAPEGLASEALSKAVFVMGVQRGLALIAAMPDVDALIVDADGALHASAGWQRSPPVRR